MPSKHPRIAVTSDPELAGALERVRVATVTREGDRGVLSAMRALAGAGSHGAHRLALADLTVAVAAQQSGLVVLHHDRHFERLGDLVGIQASWIAEPTD
jgi:predicted nucleic acid-binding protein